MIFSHVGNDYLLTKERLNLYRAPKLRVQMVDQLFVSKHFVFFATLDETNPTHLQNEQLTLKPPLPRFAYTPTIHVSLVHPSISLRHSCTTSTPSTLQGRTAHIHQQPIYPSRLIYTRRARFSAPSDTSSWTISSSSFTTVISGCPPDTERIFWKSGDTHRETPVKHS